MTVLQALQQIETMSYEEVRNGFTNVKDGIREFLAKEKDIVDIILFLEQKVGMSIPVCVKDQTELMAYISGYAKCMTSFAANGMCHNQNITFEQTSEFFEELAEYRSEFVETVTRALVDAYKRRNVNLTA